MKDADVSKKGNEKRVDISIWCHKVENVGTYVTSNLCNIGLSYFCPDDDVEKHNRQNTNHKSDCILKIYYLIYRTRAIITRGLYTFYPLFEVQKRFFKELFS